MEVTTEELLEVLGEEFAKELSEISFEEAMKSYEEIRSDFKCLYKYVR